MEYAGLKDMYGAEDDVRNAMGFKGMDLTALRSYEMPILAHHALDAAREAAPTR